MLLHKPIRFSKPYRFMQYMVRKVQSYSADERIATQGMMPCKIIAGIIKTTKQKLSIK